MDSGAGPAAANDLQKSLALLTEPKPPAIHHGPDIPLVAEPVELTLAHGAKGTIGCRPVGDVVGQAEIVSHFVVGHLQGPVEEKTIIGIRMETTQTSFFGFFPPRIVL